MIIFSQQSVNQPKMLVLILFSFTLWNEHVFCNTHSNSSQLEELFMKKHMSNTGKNRSFWLQMYSTCSFRIIRRYWREYLFITQKHLKTVKFKYILVDQNKNVRGFFQFFAPSKGNSQR
jgi:hypothetical protein